MAIRKMRTAAGVLVEFRKDDPDTEISLHLIRRIIGSGEIPVVHAGKKLLVNVADVEACIARGYGAPVYTPGTIRPLPERV